MNKAIDKKDLFLSQRLTFCMLTTHEGFFFFFFLRQLVLSIVFSIKTSFMTVPKMRAEWARLKNSGN